MEYKPWKEALLREVSGLDLDASQWLELLNKRTSGDANQLMKDLRVLELESSPEHALQSAWHTLDQRFHTKHRPSQRLLQNLRQGPTISSSDPHNLYAFARSCQTATELRQRNRALLTSIEEQTTQENIIRRLEQKLFVEWHTFRREHFEDELTVPFENFSRWIIQQAQIYLECQDSDQTPFQHTLRSWGLKPSG